MQKACFLILPLLYMMSGVSFDQTQPAPIPVKVEIPQIDWGGMISKILGEVHPALVVAIGFFISIWAFSFISTMFKGIVGMGSGDRDRGNARERARNERMRETIGGLEYRAQAQHEQEESDRRRDEAYDQYHDAAFWNDYREGRI